MASKIVWVRSPEVIQKALLQYQDKVMLAVYATAAYWGQRMQNDARQKAKWEDRTGNARSGIFFAVDMAGMPPLLGQLQDISIGMKGNVLKRVGKNTKVSETRKVSVDDRSAKDITVVSAGKDTVLLALSHTMWYGKFLELSNGGRYAIIMSTIERNLPNLERSLQKIFKG